MKPIRVIIADDHPIVRAGTRTELEKYADITVVGEAADGQEALQLAQALRPDVLLLDVEMPKLNGVEVAERLRREKAEVRVLVLSAYADREYVYGLLDKGASGYLLKEEADADLIAEAVRGVARGEDDWISKSLAARILRRQRGSDSVVETLTEREVEVLRLVALGFDNQRIGEHLFISPHTVKNHLDKIKNLKVGVRTRTELAVWAWQHGIVKPGEEP